MATTSSRRSFLKVGLLGMLALATAGGLYRLTRPKEMPSPFTMDEAARSVLMAVVPAMLKDAVSSPADIDAAITHVEDAPLFDHKVEGFSGAPQTIYSDHFLDTQPIDGPIGYKLEAPPLHPLLLCIDHAWVWRPAHGNDETFRQHARPSGAAARRFP